VFHVPAIVSELTVDASLKDRLQMVETFRLAKLATAHQTAETKANRTFQTVRFWLALTRHAPQR
jgi:hypothetical protein